MKIDEVVGKSVFVTEGFGEFGSVAVDKGVSGFWVEVGELESMGSDEADGESVFVKEGFVELGSVGVDGGVSGF